MNEQEKLIEMTSDLDPVNVILIGWSRDHSQHQMIVNFKPEFMEETLRLAYEDEEMLQMLDYLSVEFAKVVLSIGKAKQKAHLN